jgi:two-component system response regulator AtoC
MPRILVIDDDQHFRYYLVTLLERAGYQTLSLEDGLRADALLEAEAVDAVVTDLYMPNADGIEIVGIVRRTKPSVPVIGITGGVTRKRDPCIRAMEMLGAMTVLAKPLDAEAFLGVLRDAIERGKQLAR